MCTALAPRIGYDNAAAIAKRAYKEGVTVREVALGLVGLTPEQAAERLGAPATAASLKAKGGVPSPDEVERLLEPHGQTVRGTGVGGSAGG
jgi:fumarate hydratase class II